MYENVRIQKDKNKWKVQSWRINETNIPSHLSWKCFKIVPRHTLVWEVGTLLLTKLADGCGVWTKGKGVFPDMGYHHGLQSIVLREVSSVQFVRWSTSPAFWLALQKERFQSSPPRRCRTAARLSGCRCRLVCI